MGRLWLTPDGRLEVSIDLGQWVIGWNRWRYREGQHGWNVFLLCLRIGRNPAKLADVLAMNEP